MTDKPSILAFALCVIVVALYVVGSFVQGGLVWGIHHLSFLPVGVLIGYIIVSGLGMYVCLSRRLDAQLRKLGDVMNEKPALVLLIAIVLFLATSYFFRVRIPLLGDSFVIVNNFENTFRGEHSLKTSHEPAAMHYFYSIMRLLGTTSYPSLMDGFLVAEMILGVLFILAVFTTTRILLPESKSQLLLFAFLLAPPYVQLFMGYAEVYSVTLLMLALIMLAFVLVLHRKMPLYALVPLFVLSVVVHYLTLILLPAVLYLAYHECSERRWKSLLVSALTGSLTVLIILTIAGFNVKYFTPRVQHAHYLLPFPVDDGYQAYTLFSVHHAVDLLNLVLLVCPGGIILLTITLMRNKRVLWSSPIARVLLLSTIAFMLFLSVAKFDLGLAKDWDIPGPFFYLVALYAGYTALVEGGSKQLLTAVIVLTCINTSVFVALNATEEPNIRRTQALLDARNVAINGIYQSSCHFSTHYIHTKNVAALVDVWERYVSRFPTDGRGYERLAQAYWELGANGYPKIAETYERWMRVDSTNDNLRTDYSGFCVLVGNQYWSAGDPKAAASQFLKALNLNPASPAAYNNIGLLYHAEKNYEKAISFYAQAIDADSSYAIAYKNMGNAYLDVKKPRSAIEMYRRALAIDSNYTSAHEHLAKAYMMIGEQTKGIAAYQRAARRGSVLAQQLLREKGYGW